MRARPLGPTALMRRGRREVDLPLHFVHPFQRPLPPDLGRAWSAALKDARVTAERALLVTQSGSASGDGQCAVYMRRGLIVEIDGLDATLLEELNSETTGCVDAHRVIVWTDRRIESAAALIRHELEHARQIDARPEVAELHDLAQDVIRGHPNSGRLYQQIPAEADANAASGTWARSYFGVERVEGLLAEHDAVAAALRGSLPPPNPADLPERMIEFFVSIADLCRQWAAANEFRSFSSFLDLAWRGAGKRWEQLAGPR